jgi:hypothetical protein
MKTTSHNPVEPIEQQHYKKKYLTRKQQEEEAKDAIRRYNHEEASRGTEESPMPEAPTMVEKRQL